MRFEPKLVKALYRDRDSAAAIKLRGCQPRDLIEHALALAHYFNRKRELTEELLSAACAGYFVSDERDVASCLSVDCAGVQRAGCRVQGAGCRTKYWWP